MRLLSAVALMAVRPSPPCLGWQARATRRRRRVEGGGGGGGRVAVAGGHSDHFSGLHDTVPSRRQASKQAVKLRSCGGICGAPGQRGGGGPVNQVSRGIPKPAQS